MLFVNGQVGVWKKSNYLLQSEGKMHTKFEKSQTGRLLCASHRPIDTSSITCHGLCRDGTLRRQLSGGEEEREDMKRMRRSVKL